MSISFFNLFGNQVKIDIKNKLKLQLIRIKIKCLRQKPERNSNLRVQDQPKNNQEKNLD